MNPASSSHFVLAEVSDFNSSSQAVRLVQSHVKLQTNRLFVGYSTFLHLQSHLFAVLWDELLQARSASLHLPFPAHPKLRYLMHQLSREPAVRYTAAELARRVAMSERSFLRKFQSETGSSIGKWQEQLRILMALEHLSNGESVTETAFNVGFESVSAFI